jgi:hypothetical protein
MSVESKWYGAENMKLYEDATKVGLTACAIDLQGQAILLLKQYPAVITGRLWQSIGYKTSVASDNTTDGVQSEPKEFEAIIGTNVSYAAHVEFGTNRMRMRPYLRLAKDMRMNVLNTIFANQVIKYVASNSKGAK